MIFGFLFYCFLSVHFTQHDKEVMAFFTFHKSSRTNECLNMGTRVSAFRARQCVFVFAWWFLAAVTRCWWRCGCVL